MVVNKKTRLTPKYLATVIPLTVFATLWKFSAGIWVNDILCIVIAAWIFLYLRPRIRSPLTELACFFWIYVTVHTVILLFLVDARQSTLLNNWLRLTAVAFCTVAFDTYYRATPHSTLVRGLKVAAAILACSVIVHFVLLNFAGEAGRAMAFTRDLDEPIYRRDLYLFGFGRAYGLFLEPYWAAAYLFLSSVALSLCDKKNNLLLQLLLVGAAALTCATSLIYFVPVWLVALVSRGIRPKRLLAGILAIITFVAIILSVGVWDRTMHRLDEVAAGKDGSANIRIGPTIRTCVGVMRGNWMLGYGIGNADLADIAGSSEQYGVLIDAAPAGNFSGIAAVEIFAGMGIPGLLFYFGFLWCSVRGGKVGTKAKVIWVVCILVSSNAYLITHLQFYYLCILGAFICRSNLSARSSANRAYGDYMVKSRGGGAVVPPDLTHA
jgi:hypothetical protein